jgi:hypothetical protein
LSEPSVDIIDVLNGTFKPFNVRILRFSERTNVRKIQVPET